MSKALEEAIKMEAAAIALRKALEEKEKENKIPLHTVARGQRIVGSSGRVYIVLKQMPDQGQTMVIADDFMAENVKFDEDTTNYAQSSLKEKIENEILPIVEKDFGTCKCKVRPVTFDEAREHNDLLVKEGLPDWYWTCTPWSTEKRGWKYGISVVSPSGDIGNDSCGIDSGVRPVLYLKSNIFVSEGK